MWWTWLACRAASSNVEPAGCPWGQCAAEPNPDDPVGGVVRITPDPDLAPATLEVRWSGGPYSGQVTAALAGRPLEIPLRGLPVEVPLTVVLTDGVDVHTLRGLTLDPLPSGFPIAETEGKTDTTWCVDGESEGGGVWVCVDPSGRPVASARHPAGDTVYVGLTLRAGGFALLGPSDVVVLDPLGRPLRVLTLDTLGGTRRFVHDHLDHHELIELAEGRWAGCLAFLTVTTDEIDGERFDAPGILVVDPTTAEVRWDWQLHGALGDGVTIDPTALGYDRPTLIEVPPTDWIHANALVHQRDAGRETLWLSSRSQDVLLQIDVDTDAIAAVLGSGGTFRLVDAAGAPLGPDGWFYHQHAPAWLDPTTLVLFDNGNVRAGPDGIWSQEPPWSRAYAVRLDGDTATRTFTWGSPEPGDPAHFFLASQGSVRPTAAGRWGITVGDAPPEIAELDPATGEVAFRATFAEQPAAYRATAWTPP
ncbi:MAG: aryl-sulfate sulfotransferase [Myxococcota bacterium]